MRNLWPPAAARSYLVAPLLAAVFVVLLTTSRGVVAVRDLNDLFVTFDAMWRAHLGQAPHIDFPSPIGQAYYWPFALASRLAGFGPDALLLANAIVASIVGLMSAALLPRRMTPLYFTLALLTATGVALIPRDHDGLIDPISWVAPYNTWAWAVITPLALAALLPPRRSRRLSDLLDGVLLGLLTAWLYYLKLTFFLPAVGLLAVGATLRHLPPRSVLIALTTLGLFVISVELTAHNNLAYLSDLRAASRVAMAFGKGHRAVMLAKHLAVATAFGAAFLVALRLADPHPAPVAWARTLQRPILVAAVLLVTGALIATENHPEWLNLFGCVALIAGTDLASRRSPWLAEPWRSGGEVPLAARTAAACLITACACRALLDDYAVAALALQSRSDVTSIAGLGSRNGGLLLDRRFARAAAAGYVWWGAGAHDLQPPEAGWPNTTRAKWRQPVLRDATLLFDATRLLQRHQAARQVIFAFDFSNPYPMFFRAPPPPHAQIWWDPGRNVSAEIHPDPAAMFCAVTLALQRRDGDASAATLWSIYGPMVMRDFKVVDASPYWLVWSRTSNCSGRAIPAAETLRTAAIDRPAPAPSAGKRPSRHLSSSGKKWWVLGDSNPRPAD